jgi:capsular polysaccharide biosynthesis protein
MKVQNAPAREKIVYLMRGGQGKQRSVSNEGELVNALIKESITAIRAETLSVAELIHQLAGARIIISVEGSQLSHALFNLQDRGAVLVLQPPDRFFNSHFDWARALGMHYGLVVGIDDENGFRIPVGDVLRTLDLLKRKL